MLCCPRCGGTALFLETGGYTGTIYVCKKCGYRGSFVVEIGDEGLESGEGKDPEG